MFLPACIVQSQEYYRIHNLFFLPFVYLSKNQSNKKEQNSEIHTKSRFILISLPVPEGVDSIKTVVLSDTTINISWSEPLEPNGPLESIRYQISVNLLSLFPEAPLRKSEFPNGTLSWSVSDLQSGTNNLFKV